MNANKALRGYEDVYGTSSRCIPPSSERTMFSTVDPPHDISAIIMGKKHWKSLHGALIYHKVGVLQAILNKLKPGQINKLLFKNRTVLHSLVKSEKVKKDDQAFCAHVELLLKAGINVNQGDAKNCSAIFWAAKYGCRHIIKCILENSAQPVDLDSHKLDDESARDLIIKNHLYDGTLPEPYNSRQELNLIFELIEQSKQEDLIGYLDSLTTSGDILNMDDGTSTLLQYSCDKGLQKIVVYLLNKKVDINLVTNNNKKKSVEIAASHGFHEIFALLLEHPEVTISAEVLCNLVKRFDKKKFQDIDHEQCCNILLEKMKIDKNLLNVNDKDTENNTALHYSLHYGNKATTETLLKLGASLAAKNKSKTMPIENIRYEQLEIHLDGCVKFDKDKNEDRHDYEVTFDYSTLVPLTNSVVPDGNILDRQFQNDEIDLERNMLLSSEKMSHRQYVFAPETEVINFMSRSQELKNLLTHPVIVTFLFMKWQKIRWLFYANLVLYILFMSSLFVYIFTYCTNFDITSDVSVHKRIFFVALNLTLWMLVLRESFQFTVSPKKYFFNFENYVVSGLMVVTGIMLYSREASNESRKGLSSVAILLSAFELVQMTGQHPEVSTMLKKFSKNFLMFLLWYSLIIVTLAPNFNILFAKNTSSIDNRNQTSTHVGKNVFMGPVESLFKTIIMLSGVLDSDSINIETYQILGKSIFILFVFIITIILLNLLNGLGVSDSQTILNDADLVGHITMAQNIFYVESMLFGNIVPKTWKCRFHSLICCFASHPPAEKVCLFASPKYQLVVFPNRNGQIYYESGQSREPNSYMLCAKYFRNTHLDHQTVKRILAVVKRRQIKDEAAGVDMVSLQGDIRQIKLKMEQMLLIFEVNSTVQILNGGVSAIRSGRRGAKQFPKRKWRSVY